MSKKIMMVVGYGQSNEVGTAVAPRLSGTAILNTDVVNNIKFMCTFGAPAYGVVSTAPFVANAGIFDYLKDSMAQLTGWHISLLNMARGGTAVTDNWCGWNSGTSDIKREGDAGYDPSSYIANTQAAVAASVAAGYEVWMFTAGHQQDLVLARPTAKIIEGSAYVQTRCRLSGATKHFVGMTPRYIGSIYEAEWNPGGAIYQIRDGVLASVSGSIIGANLATNTNTNLCANDTQPYVHLNGPGVTWAAGVWLNAMIASGVLTR